MREEQLLADLRRSRADLERNVGRRLDRYEGLPEAEEIAPPAAEAVPESETPPEALLDGEIRNGDAQNGDAQGSEVSGELTNTIMEVTPLVPETSE
jgi:hypothetical protein